MRLVEACNPEEQVYLITDVETTVATVPDVERIEEILSIVQERRWDLQKVLLDSGYLSGDLLVCERQQECELVGPVAPIPTLLGASAGRAVRARRHGLPTSFRRSDLLLRPWQNLLLLVSPSLRIPWVRPNAGKLSWLE